MLNLKNFLLTLVAVCSLTASVQFCWAARSPLEGKSFSIRSKVVVIPINGPTRESHLDETYSNEQRRAKINYLAEPPNAENFNFRYGTGIFYMDSGRSITLVVDGGTWTSSVTTVEEIDRFIGFTFHDDEDDRVQEDFIIGPARLLFFLSKHREKQQLVSLNGNSLRVANVACLKYTYVHTTKSGEKIKFSIFYSELSLASDAQASPMQVYIEYLDVNRADLVISYAPVELLTPSDSIRPDSEVHYQVQLDWFTFQPFVGFSTILSASHGEDLFANLPPEKTKFSFRAIVELEDGYALERYVAYDAKLGSLVLVPKWGDMAKSGLGRLLFNFKLNRLYHIMSVNPNGKTEIDRVLKLSRQDLPDDADAISDGSQCIVTKILPKLNASSSSKPLSIGELLVGSNKLVYLGRAYVRGIPALVYEASGKSGPFWLDYPLVYRASGKTGDLMRYPNSPLVEKSESVATTILLYIGEASTDKPLLRLEIFRLNNNIHKKVTVNFYDFKWDLNYDDEPESLFSLQDFCSRAIGKNQYALVKLLLESEQPSFEATEPNLNPQSEYEIEDTGILASKMGTNLALMASLQTSLKLPATMIFDIETHATGNKPLNDNKHFLLATSFRVAEHVDDLVELVYLGQGTPSYGIDVDNMGSQSYHQTRSVIGCFFLASHLRFNVFFGFDPKKRNCYINMNPVVSGSAEKPPYFTMTSGGRMEVYRIDHIQDPDKAGSESSLREMYHTAFDLYNNRTLLRGLKLNLLDVRPDHSDIEFTIRQAEVDERNSRASLADQDQTDAHPVTSDTIDGFGLVATGLESKRIYPTTISTDRWSLVNSKIEDQVTEMSYEQCHAACLTDITCRSYSICIQNSELQCVISKASFKTTNVVRQLFNSKIQTKTGLGRTIEVKLDDNQVVKVMKHPNCQLNDIVFLDQFIKPQVVRNTLANRYIYLVRDQEECAELCVGQNIDVLREDVERQAASTQSVFNPNSPLSKDNEILRTIMKQHRQATKDICKTFFYIDKARIMSLPKDTADKIRDNVISRNTNNRDNSGVQDQNYCVMAEPIRRDVEQDVQKVDRATKNVYNSFGTNEYMDLEMYSFKFELFYKKQYGVHLSGTKMTGAGTRAHELAVESRELDESHFTLLRTFVENGGNSQDIIFATVSKCAMVCFLQTWGPWPACRSFDIVLEMINDRYFSKCYLNSITLQQAVETQRLDLIDDSNEPQAWHYEPRSGFALDESNLDQKVQIAETGFEIKEIAAITKRISGYKLNSFVTFMIVLVAIGCGLFAGLKASQKFLDRKKPNMADQDLLVIPQIGLEFSNQVGEDGTVKE